MLPCSAGTSPLRTTQSRKHVLGVLEACAGDVLAASDIVKKLEDIRIVQRRSVVSRVLRDLEHGGLVASTPGNDGKPRWRIAGRDEARG